MVEPTQEELGSVAEAAKRLWELDENRLTAEVHYGIDLQGYKRFGDDQDHARKPLFRFVDKDHFFAMPTYSSFYRLLDNYERETGQSEKVTQQEVHENRHFIDEIVKTKPIQYLHNYLVAKDLAPEDLQKFKYQLYNLWFGLFSRESHNDSSAFEHVFVGEIRDGKVIGFHNWIQLFIEERKGGVDYKGFICPRKKRHDPDYVPDADDRLISLNFTWGREEKSVSSTFLGVSPEFEVALYTLCFYCGQENNHMHLDEYNVNIKCYKFRGNHLSTSYPEMINKSGLE